MWEVYRYKDTQQEIYIKISLSFSSRDLYGMTGTVDNKIIL